MERFSCGAVDDACSTLSYPVIRQINLQGLYKVSKEGNVLQARLWTRQVSAVGLELQKEQDKLQERLIKQSTELFELRDRYEQALRTLKGKGKAIE